MWSFSFSNESEINDFKLIVKNINKEEVIDVNKANAIEISPIIKRFLEKNQSLSSYIITLKEYLNDSKDIIQKIFNGDGVIANENNEAFLNEFANELDISELKQYLSMYELNILIELERIVFSLSDEDASLSDASDLLKLYLDNSGKETICHLIINACISRPLKISIFLEFIEMNDLENVMCRILLMQMETLDNIFTFSEIKVQTVSFLTRYYFNKGKINQKQILSLYKNPPMFFADLNDILEVNKDIFDKLAESGFNPDPIAKILREDDIDSIQERFSKSNLDVNGIIRPSDFERSDLINQGCKYIEFAAFYGSLKCFKFLFLNGADLRQYLSRFAVAGGNFDIIHILLENNFLFSDCHEVAIKYHRWEIFEWICNNFSDLPKTPSNVFGLPYKCIQFSNFKTFNFFIENDADYNLSLPLAVDYNNLLLARWLLKRYEFLFKDKTSKRVEKTLIHFACRNQNVDMLKLLLKTKKFPINYLYDGKTALEIAIERQNLEIFKILLDLPKVLLDKPDHNGKQAIHYASSIKNSEFIKLLIDNDRKKVVDINSKDKSQLTPLHYACLNNCTDPALYLLSFPTIQLNSQDKSGKTQIQLACMFSSPVVVKKLLDILPHEIASNAISDPSKSLLHFAIMNKSFEVPKIILEREHIDINAFDINRKTPLMQAISLNNIKFVEEILKFPEINVNIQDNLLMTPLHIACRQRDSLEIIMLLVKHPKILLNLKDSYQNKPLSYAIQFSSPRVVTHLISLKNIDLEDLDKFGSSARELAKSIDRNDILVLFE